MERDLELAAVRQVHARAQAAFAAKTVEHPRNRARIAAQLGGFALEAVNFFNDFNRHEDIMFLKIDERIRIVEQDVGVENEIFHAKKKRQIGLPPQTRRWIGGSDNSIKISLNLFQDFFTRQKGVNDNPLEMGKI